MEQNIKIKKVKNIIKGNVVRKNKPLKSRIFKGLLGLTFFYFALAVSTTHYIDNKAKSIVTDEQREKLSTIISIEKSENFLVESFNTDYSQEMYNQDYTLFDSFKLKMKQDFDDLFKSDEYVRNNFKEYNNNYEKFLNDFKKNYDYNDFFLKYYYVTKIKDSGIVENNYNIYYYRDKVLNNNIPKLFFRNKINQNKDKINQKVYNNIPLIKEYNNIIKSEEFNNNYKYLFIDLFNGKDYVNRYVAKHNIISHQFDNIYSKFILYSNRTNDKNEQYYFNEIKKYKDLSNIDNKEANERVNFLINNFVSDKIFLSNSLNLENKNDPYVKNTFMIENVRIKYLNLKNEIYEIRKQNEKNFSDFNYKTYYYLGLPLVYTKYFFNDYMNYDFEYGESPLFDKNIKVYMSNATSDPVNLFLSGFNDGFKSNSLFNNYYYYEMITPDRYKTNGFEAYKYSGLN